MAQSFADMLQEGKPNSLGRVPEIIESVLNNRARLEELYQCLFLDNSWARMRAADALEKVCRIHPQWLEVYIDKLQENFSSHSQASIQWHLAQIYQQVVLTDTQKANAIAWLTKLLNNDDTDWIVAANCMDALVYFVNSGDVSKETAEKLFKKQLNHKSNAVKRRADKYLQSYDS